MSAKKVMVTGVYGLIASAIYKRLCADPARYDVYGLARRRHPSVRVADDWTIDIPEGHFFQSDLSDIDVLVKAFDGMDVVVHMAAEPSPEYGAERILKSNVIGGYNVFEACRLAGVKRIIAASSMMVTYGHLNDEPYRSIMHGDYENVSLPIPMVTADTPARPRDIYACSKVWAESLARTYSTSHGMSCIALRIGWVVHEDRPPYPAAEGIWCSQRDIVQLAELCINAPDDLRFDIFHGLSNNRWRWADIEHAHDVLGYEPQDRGEDYITD